MADVTSMSSISASSTVTSTSSSSTDNNGTFTSSVATIITSSATTGTTSSATTATTSSDTTATNTSVTTATTSSATTTTSSVTTATTSSVTTATTSSVTTATTSSVTTATTSSATTATTTSATTGTTSSVAATTISATTGTTSSVATTTTSSPITATTSSVTTSTTSSATTSTTSSATTTTTTCTAADMAASSVTGTPNTQASSMAQFPRVVFDDAYRQGTVYVLPPIHELKVNVFQDTNEKTPLDPAMPYKTKTHAMQVDEAKLTSGQDKLKGDQDEACVLKLLYEQLQKATHPGDTPVFLFCSLMLSNHEKDIVIFHRKYGVIIVEVKGVENPRSFSRLQKAAEQLLKARDAIRTELQGLLAPDAVTLLMALPNLTDASNARQSMQILRDNPDIQLLCGREEADYKTFIQQLPTRPDPLVWEAQPDSHQAFVTAVSRHLSVEVYSPTETASALAQVHRSWLLTPDQASILHCHHRLLHLWGPPGAGKTLLLLHRVKLWLQDNKHVILCVGSYNHSVLLQHLGRTSVSGNGGKLLHNLTLCRNKEKFHETVNELERQGPPKDICIVVDEVNSHFRSQALTAFQQGNIFCLWTASVEDIPDTQSMRFSGFGGKKVLLLHSLRCPPHVVEVAGKVLQATPRTPAMTSFPCLPATMPTASVKVCFHPSHPGYRPLDKVDYHFDCGVCSHWLRSSLSPLVEGLPLQHPQWRHWVILYTWGYSERNKSMESKLVEWLRKHGVPAVNEMEREMNASNLPFPVVQGSGVRDDSAEWRERVVGGVDRHGNTAVHFVNYNFYLGMEKPCVLVLHWDREDDLSNQSPRDDRERRHREAWFGAMTRCQAELCVWIISPSPAVSCLLFQEETEERQRIWEEQRIQEKLRRRHEKELARWTEEIQERRRLLEAEKRLSEEEMERCRQEEQRIQEEEQRIQEEEQWIQEEQRIREERQHEEYHRRGKDLARQTEEVQERRRHLDAEQCWLQEDMDMCSWEEQRIQTEEQQIQEEEGILEEGRRRLDKAVQQMWKALQRRDVATARQIREELERQTSELSQLLYDGREKLEKLELQIRRQKGRQREERQRWEEERRLFQEEMEKWHRIQEKQRCRHEVELARWTEEVQGRRRRLEAEKRLSQVERKRCRQKKQRIQEKEQRIREEEQRIREERHHGERGRRGKELARQTEEVQERRRRLDAKQRWLQEDIDMCSREEQRIQIEEEQIQEKEQILEEERRRRDEAAQQMREALQRRDVETARGIRKELERQIRKLRQRQHGARQMLKDLELQMRTQKERQSEERQRWEEERRRRRCCVIQ